MKIKANLILVLIIAIYIFIAAMSMYQYYVGDEVLDVTCAKAITQNGFPITPYGAEMPDYKCEHHIPLYRYILAGIISVFGDNIYLIKSFMMMFNVLTVILIYLITKEILKENHHKDYWALAAVCLYIFNPLTLINSIIVEPDGSLVNFGLTLFLYLFVKKKNYFFLFPALLFIFFSKEIGPIVLFASLFLFYLITKNYKKIPSIFLLFLGAGIITGITWFIYTLFAKFDFLMFFKFNFGAAQKNFNLVNILTSLWTQKLFVYFAVPFFILLFLILTVLFYRKAIKNKDFLKNEENKNILLMNLFALVVLLIYFYVGDSSYGFIKYQDIAMPAISIFIISMLSKSNIFEYLKSKKLIKTFLVLILILSTFFILFVKNPLIPEFDETRTNVNISEVINPVMINFSLYFLIPFVFTFSFLFVKLKKLRAALLVSLLLLTMFAYFYIDVVHMTADYSTHFKYGDTGKKEVLEYLKENNISAWQVITHINIGYYLNLSEYHEIVFTHYRDNPELFKKEYAENEDIKYLIIWNRDISKFGENIKYFELEKQIGSYYIYKKIQNSSLSSYNSV
ncbi:MAG: glycosyltransferase family 39 protein [Nanoarchaeota archaeon]|nr:glycosyltransferase family 39 protein [Nanoarchaeota archaeon]